MLSYLSSHFHLNPLGALRDTEPKCTLRAEHPQYAVSYAAGQPLLWLFPFQLCLLKHPVTQFLPRLSPSSYLKSIARSSDRQNMTHKDMVKGLWRENKIPLQTRILLPCHSLERSTGVSHRRLWDLRVRQVAAGCGEVAQLTTQVSQTVPGNSGFQLHTPTVLQLPLLVLVESPPHPLVSPWC